MTPPVPLTRFTTPRGMPAFTTRSTSRTGASGASSDGLMTMVLPAASAGASFQIVSDRGAFHGTIAATTPIGSRTV